MVFGNPEDQYQYAANNPEVIKPNHYQGFQTFSEQDSSQIATASHNSGYRSSADTFLVPKYPRENSRSDAIPTTMKTSMWSAYSPLLKQYPTHSPVRLSYTCKIIETGLTYTTVENTPTKADRTMISECRHHMHSGQSIYPFAVQKSTVSNFLLNPWSVAKKKIYIWRKGTDDFKNVRAGWEISLTCGIGGGCGGRGRGMNGVALTKSSFMVISSNIRVTNRSVSLKLAHLSLSSSIT